MIHRARLRLAALSAAGLVIAGACGGDSDDQRTTAGAISATTTTTAAPAPVTPTTAEAPAPGKVEIAAFAFAPSPVRTRAGQMVTWTNTDAVTHSIQDTSGLGTPVSPGLAKGDSFSITYPKPGTYSYICGIHPSMEGSVEVAR